MAVIRETKNLNKSLKAKCYNKILKGINFKKPLYLVFEDKM